MKRAALLLLFSAPAFSQAPASPLTFEVADVKVNKYGDLRINGGLIPTGKFLLDAGSGPVQMICLWNIRKRCIFQKP